MTNPNPPKDIGSAVPEGFMLPHNTTRTMADVWANDEEYEQARSSGSRGGLATKARRLANQGKAA